MSHSGYDIRRSSPIDNEEQPVSDTESEPETSIDHPGDRQEDAKHLGKVGEPYGPAAVRTLARWIAMDRTWPNHITETMTKFHKKVKSELRPGSALPLICSSSMVLAMSPYGRSAIVAARKVSRTSALQCVP